jgi:hypothetical protein
MIEGPKVGSIWRHTQRDYFVVYKSVRTGSLNVRPVPEFMDGRFVWVKDAD